MNGMRSAADVPDNDILVARARKGDLDALEGLYRSHERAVFRIASRLCRRPEDAEEVVQETFMELVRSIRSFRGDSPVGHWLGRIAASKALTRLRALGVRRGEESLDEGWEMGEQRLLPDPFTSRPGAVLAQIDLEAALDRLSDTSRAVVWLHDVEGYTHDEIAKLMGKTESFSKSQLARAHDRLRAALGATAVPTGESQACTRA